jgi:transcriptional regulator with XRE-family HTH domain
MGMDGRRNLAEAVGWAFNTERARHNLSQTGAAYRLGMTQQWVSKVERGAIGLTVDMVERLFALFDLQVRLELEPAGADLDGEIDHFVAMTDPERAAVVNGFGRTFAQLSGVPWVLSGRLGAFVQGAPVRVLRLDLAVADADLDALHEVFERHPCDRWNERLMDYYGAPLDPRRPGAMRWLLGLCEVRLEIVDSLPAALDITVGGRTLPVRPLADIEARYADVARLMKRTRTRLSTVSNDKVTCGRAIR